MALRGDLRRFSLMFLHSYVMSEKIDFWSIYSCEMVCFVVTPALFNNKPPVVIVFAHLTPLYTVVFLFPPFAAAGHLSQSFSDAFGTKDQAF